MASFLTLLRQLTISMVMTSARHRGVATPALGFARFFSMPCGSLTRPDRRCHGDGAPNELPHLSADQVRAHKIPSGTWFLPRSLWSGLN